MRVLKVTRFCVAVVVAYDYAYVVGTCIYTCTCFNIFIYASKYVNVLIHNCMHARRYTCLGLHMSMHVYVNVNASEWTHMYVAHVYVCCTSMTGGCLVQAVG